MSIKDLRKELKDYVENADEKLLNALHETALVYIKNKQLDDLIKEGEDDIKEGRVHSQKEVQKMIQDWTAQ